MLSGKLMRYRTAAISCFAVIAVMFGVPALIWAAFLPSLKRALAENLPYTIPTYERILLEIAVFCGNWKWLVGLPALSLGLLFTIIGFEKSRALL